MDQRGADHYYLSEVEHILVPSCTMQSDTQFICWMNLDGLCSLISSLVSHLTLCHHCAASGAAELKKQLPNGNSPGEISKGRAQERRRFRGLQERHSQVGLPEQGGCRPERAAGGVLESKRAKFHRRLCTAKNAPDQRTSPELQIA